jgi:hypothetical protein
MGAGTVEGDFLTVPDERYQALLKKYRNQPAAHWPAWALTVALFAAKYDRGVGDTVLVEIGGPKTPRFKAWHEAVFGILTAPCGCDDQFDQWNRLFPYLQGS